MNLPKHDGGLSIEHNQHKNYYQPIREYITDNDLAEDFESPGAMEDAIRADSLWVMQWYPDTPVGFICVAAATLEDVLRMAIE